MPASYPTSVKAFTTKSDGAGNTILAAHVNDLQSEVTAIETDLIAGLPVTRGGTGALTHTNHGVLLGQAASAVVATSAGTAGQVFTSNGASADPSFQAITFADWVAVTFAAGNFTANGAQTWTVASGDVGLNRYVRLGKTLIWSVTLNQTTVGGTPNTNLILTLPASLTAAGTNSGSFFYTDNGTGGSGLWLASGTTILLFVVSLGNWTAATDATGIRATFVLETTT